MAEPIYIAQTAEPMTNEQGREWIETCCKEGAAQGAMFFRATVNDERHLLLVEGWAEIPADPGVPRWQMARH